MSADLLAEFGTPQPQRQQSRRSDAQPKSTAAILLPDFQSPQLEPVQTRPAAKANEPLWNKDSEGANILFDALNPEGEEDDFGDFEVVNGDERMTDMSQTSKGTDDLIEAKTITTDRTSSALLDDDNGWGDFENVPGISHPPVIAPGAVVSQSTARSNDTVEADEMDEWEAFEDGKDERTDQKQSELLKETIEQAQIHLGSQVRLASKEKAETSSPALRPTNIPPPGVLLQILPGIFIKLRNLSNETKVPSTETAHAITQAYLATCRLVAGRSLRWKRDTILAQSTKIGPAASGKSGGMKLASIDKSEGMKEERDASDAVDAWSRNTRVFSSVLAKANIRRNILALNPMLLPRADRQPGVLTATYACALCGIRRDERLPNIDVDVSDSFGEFWVEHWGHRDCQEFWDTYKLALQQR